MRNFPQALHVCTFTHNPPLTKILDLPLLCQRMLDNCADTSSRYTCITVLGWLHHAPHGATRAMAHVPGVTSSCLLTPLLLHGRLQRSPRRSLSTGVQRKWEGTRQRRKHYSFSHMLCFKLEFYCVILPDLY